MVSRMFDMSYVGQVMAEFMKDISKKDKGRLLLSLSDNGCFYQSCLPIQLRILEGF